MPLKNQIALLQFHCLQILFAIENGFIEVINSLPKKRGLEKVSKNTHIYQVMFYDDFPFPFQAHISIILGPKPQASSRNKW